MTSQQLIAISLICFSLTAQSNMDCRVAHPLAPTIEKETVDGADPSLILGFSQDPKILKKIENAIKDVKVRSKVEKIKGFNDTIVQVDAPRLEKSIRQETPRTVAIMGTLLVREIKRLGHFDQIGLVYGDPHFGNLNSSPNVFRGRDDDRNRYTLVDLDEVSFGFFALDFARNWIFLKAKFGDLQKTFGKKFEDELFENYSRGLRQEEPSFIPAFVAKSLNATPSEVREKIQGYADKRINPKDGKFKSELFAKNELAEFKTKNMKPEFLQKMGFDLKDKKSDKKEFKSEIVELVTKAMKSEFPDRIQVLDIAIPMRDGGGSVDMQRFVVSTEVEFEGKSYRMILEFKENVEKAAWDAVIESKFDSSAQRYQFGLDATMDDTGPFLKVVEFNKKLSFLMRPKGNIDVEIDGSRDQNRQKALFDAYVQGLFHGSQGPHVSKEFVDKVNQNLKEFQETVISVGTEVLTKFSKEAGLKLPKAKK